MSDDEDYDDKPAQSLFRQRLNAQRVVPAGVEVAGYEDCVYTFDDHDGYGSLFFGPNFTVVLVHVGAKRLCGRFKYHRNDEGEFCLHDPGYFSCIKFTPTGADLQVFMQTDTGFVSRLYFNKCADKLRRQQPPPAAPAPPRDFVSMD